MGLFTVNKEKRVTRETVNEKRESASLFRVDKNKVNLNWKGEPIETEYDNNFNSGNKVIIDNVEIDLPDGDITMSGGSIIINGEEIDIAKYGKTINKNVGITVIGNVSKIETKGNVTVKGNVEGSIISDNNITINGSVKGDVEADNNVTINGSHIGDIEAGNNIITFK